MALAHTEAMPIILWSLRERSFSCQTSCHSRKAPQSLAVQGRHIWLSKKLDVSGRDTLAIYGQGPVGLSATLLGKAMGARVIAIDVAPARLEHALRLGADATLNPTAGDPVSGVQELTDGEGADATLDCTGNATARAQTVRSARVFGRACFVGEGGTVELEPSPDIIHRHLSLYGSWTFNTVGLEECARFIVRRAVPLDRLITHRFQLDQAVEAFQLFDKGETGKCVFVM
jgi:threonine dehydrogenase-like Zn-dependent dehydrogenase